MNRLRSDDSGVAAVEAAFTLGVLLTVVALIYPIGEMLLQKMALDRAMSDVIRYSTAAPNSPEYDPDGAINNPTNSRRPTCTQVQNEFNRAYNGSLTGIAPISITVNGTPACPSAVQSGQTVTVTVSKTVSLGPLGDLLSIAHITHSSSVTVSAAASGREE